MSVFLFFLAVVVIWTAMIFCCLFAAKKHDEASQRATEKFFRDRKGGAL